MSQYCPYQDERVVYTVCQECEQKICSENTFFCLVVGSRTFCDYPLLKDRLDYFLSAHTNVVIVSGGARGADTLAVQYAQEKNYPYLVFSADWTQGKSAGYVRNRKMHQFIAKQKHRGCVAFWDGKSKGTQHNFALAKEYHTPLRIINTSKQKMTGN